MSEPKTVSWKNMSWLEKIKFALGVLFGVSVKYYEEPKPDDKAKD